MNKFDALLDCELEKKIVSKKIETINASVKFKILTDDKLDLVGNLYDKGTIVNPIQEQSSSSTPTNVTTNTSRNLVRRLLQQQFVSVRFVEYVSRIESMCIQNIRQINDSIECDVQHLTNGNRFSYIEIFNRLVLTRHQLMSLNSNTRHLQLLNDNIDQCEDRIFLNLLNSNEPKKFIVRDRMSVDVIFEMLENFENPQTILIHPQYIPCLAATNLFANFESTRMFAGLDVIVNPFLGNKIYILSREFGHLINFNERAVSYNESFATFTTNVEVRERINLIISKNFSSCRITNGTTK